MHSGVLGAPPACAPWASPGTSEGDTGEGAEAGLEEESTAWSERSEEQGKDAAKEPPAFVSRERER